MVSSERTRDSRSGSSSGVSNLLGERGENDTVILPGLICESEESEKDERADDDCPSTQLYVDNSSVVRFPFQSRVLADVAEVGVRVRPRNPFVNTGFRSAVGVNVLVDRVASQGDREEQFDTR